MTKTDSIYECRACGRFRKDNIKPLAGDRVSFVPIGNKNGSIDQIIDRKNSLIRPPVANVDKLAIVISASVPAADFWLCDKLLAQAELSGIMPFICINKADEDKNLIPDIINQYQYYKIFAVSALTGKGLNILKSEIEDCCVCFTGQSAVGKSSLINALGYDKNLKVGTLSKKTERGKHTTRVTELLFIKELNAFVFDTPGFSSLEIRVNNKSDAQMYYPEFNEFKNKCQYAGCLHVSEPICSVRQAVEDGRISKERYNRYINLIEKINSERK